MRPSILLIQPVWSASIAPAVAAARGGHVGLLDFGRGLRERRGQGMIAALREAAGETGWGARLELEAVTDAALREGLDFAGAAREGATLPWLLLGGTWDWKHADLAAAARQARRHATRVLAEGLDPDGAARAVAAGFDGVVLTANEAGGRVGSRSAFMLMQDLAAPGDTPIWIRGAWGPDTAAAAAFAGFGIALCEEAWLASDALLPPGMRARLEAMDGSESIAREASGVIERLERLATHRAAPHGAPAPGETGTGARHQPPSPLPLGQGIGLARALAAAHGHTGAMLAAFRRAMEEQPALASRALPLSEGGPMAAALGTRFPILQGPMTRVSDTPEFCAAVAEAGGLPFLALALMRASEVRRLVRATHDRMGERPWGIGILGFVPPELRQEQLEAALEHPPRFAIIAGGRPSQARVLEARGIATYLHVPSPDLLRAFLEAGARRFILEGRECGGHVGPRSSLVLWQSALQVLEEARLPDPEAIHLVFAGGIHDPLSAAMVEVLAAPAAARGMRIGVLMGTAYLFTREAVATGAITSGYQEEALRCASTVLLDSGVGHATRCAPTPFAEEFARRKAEMLGEGKDTGEIRFELEMLNVGRLRLASKGLARAGADQEVGLAAAARARLASEGVEEAGAIAPDTHLARGAGLLSGPLTAVDGATQHREGMFMIGEVATLRRSVLSMADLHAEVCDGSARLLRERAPVSAAAENAGPGAGAAGEPIAIIGMACRFPGAGDLRAFWGNILAGHDAVTEVPPDRWPAEMFYSSDRTDPDRAYSRWGGFLGPVRFDPVRYRLPPASVPSIEPVQLLALEVAADALVDAGYDRRPFPRQRTDVIFGSGGVHERGVEYALRTLLPQSLASARCLGTEERDRIVAEVRAAAPAWTEDAFPGLLLNVLAGRVANVLDLGGANYVIDAACASSLAAVQAAMEHLRARSCDLVLAGAADATNHAFTFVNFARTHALTPSGRSRPFDDSADGIVLGEGIGVIVLKRLEDAQRDGDRVYAVLRGIGSSSDGRNRSLTAPHPPGQAMAIRRAYADAGLDPRTVTLIEAHGTGTTVGDHSEIEAMREIFDFPGRGEAYCALGSIKSMIGHAKTAAGMAGLIKTALALSQRVQPPTIHVEVPNRKARFEDSPFWINSEPRPWVGREGEPRRAGVSAFGFGGTNFHAVLEEDAGGSTPDLSPRPVEILFLDGPDRGSVAGAAARLREAIERGTGTSLARLARSHLEARREAPLGPAAARLALVARDTADLLEGLREAVACLAAPAPASSTPRVHFSDAPAVKPSGLCFLYPGQGSQRVHMLREIVLADPAALRLLGEADAELADLLSRPLSRTIYPPPAFDRETADRQRRELTDTRVAQPALGVIDLAATDLLTRFGLAPAMTAGHSYGEYVALAAAGTCTPRELLRLSAVRGRMIHESARSRPGGMAAVSAPAEEVERLLAEIGLAARVANLNAPEQTIIGGSEEEIATVLREFPRRGIAARRVAVSAAFHTPAMEEPAAAFAGVLDQVALQPPRIPVYSNVTGEPYPGDLAALRHQLVIHLARPVRFVDQVRAMHRDGARVFVEVGPGRILTSLVGRILEGEEHVALSFEAPGQTGWPALASLLARLFALGLPVDPAPWFDRRPEPAVPLAVALEEERRRAEVRPTEWILTPRTARPATGRIEKPIPPPGPPPAHPTTTTGGPLPAAFTDPSEVPIMTDNAKPGPGPHAPPPAPGSLDQVQRNLSLWLELQQEQQRLSAQFLAVQERIATLLSGTTIAAEPRLAEPVPRETILGVAPAPVIPGLRPPPVLPPRDPDLLRSAAPAEDAAPPLVPSRPAPAGATLPEAVADTPADGEPPGVDRFQADLLREAARRTGYPEEMLDLDTPLEAGLGIDSIKTMEIFSALKPYHHVLAGEDMDEEDVLNYFVRMKTMRDIVRHYAERRREHVGEPAAAGPPSPAPARGKPAPEAAPREAAPREAAPVLAEAGAPPRPFDTGEQAPVERLTLRAVPVPLPASGIEAALERFPRQRPFLFLGESRDLTGSLEAALEATGCRVARVLHGHRLKEADGDGAWEADLDDPAEMRQLAEAIRARHGEPIGALVNWLGLGEQAANGSSEDALRLLQRLTAAAQAFESQLRDSAKIGGGWVFNLTSLDGRFGLKADRALAASQAGSLGFFKSLAREWRGTRVQNIDLDPGLRAEAAVSAIIQEIAGGNGDLEIGVDGEGRWRLDLLSDPLPDTARERSLGKRLGLGPESVVLATGGGTGITAEVLRALARETAARLVIVGRTPAGGIENEPEEVRGVEGREALRAGVIAACRRLHPGCSPAILEAELRRVIKARELKANLAAFKDAGSTVAYHALDLQDEEQFSRLIDATYAAHGRIDAVIHGAGVIEDRRLEHKTAESAARVFLTKVRPALVLARRLDPARLRFAVFFSSLSARLGNAGQCDYSAANELLNKLAVELDRRWPCRVVAVNWGPWEIGMLSPALRQAYQERGIVLIPSRAGVAALLEELASPAARQPEVVLACAPSALIRQAARVS